MFEYLEFEFLLGCNVFAPARRGRTRVHKPPELFQGVLHCYYEDVQLKRSVLNETYCRRTQVEQTNDAVKDCSLGHVRVHARAQVFLALCLRLVVAITNDERGDNPGREMLKSWDEFYDTLNTAKGGPSGDYPL